MPYFLGPTVTVPLKPEVASKPSAPYRGARRRHSQPASWFGGWIRSILPSHRAERGGTARAHGFWEQQHTGQASRRAMTDSHQSRRSEAFGSDHIVGWNMAREMPQTVSAVQQQADRKWSWVPTPKHQVDEQEAMGQGARDPPLKTTIERRLAQTRQLIETRKEARQQRRNLKESGDYLGVQGINPETGRLDVMTPTDSSPERRSSSASHETQQKLQVLRKALRDARHTYKQAKERGEQVASTIELESQTHKLRRLDQGKQRRNQINQRVRWRRQTKQWSSAQEPGLSPIAQSRVASRHQSRLDSAMHPPQPLIDVGSPQRRSASRKANAGSHSSTATVVRTPQRASLMSPTPSAWELFENGISFNASESSQAGGAPIVSSAAAPPLLSKSAHDSSDAPGPASSFLGGRAPGGTIRGGSVMEWSQTSQTSMTPSQTRLAPHASLQSLLPQARDKAERDLPTERPRFRTGQLKELQPRDKGSLRRLMPQWSSPRAVSAKAGISQALQGRAQGQQVSLVALEPLKRLGHGGQGVGSQASRIHLALLQPTMRTRPRGDDAVTDATLPHTVPRAHVEARRQGDVDMEWINNAIRDINKRSLELQDEYASTHITTTTGSDRVMSQCRPWAMQEARQSETKTLAGKQQLETPQCSVSRSSLPRPAVMVRDIATSPLASAWPKSRLMGAQSATASDTTLVRQGDTMVQRTQALAAKPPAALVSTTASTSPKSTSTPPADSHGLVRDESLETMGLLAKAAPKSATDGHEGAGQLTKTLWVIDEEDEGSKVPGAYPAELGFQDGTVHSRRGRDAPENGGRLLTSMGSQELSQAAHRLLGLYLATVMPVLDSSSEYWMRNARRETTLKDSFAMLLTLPAALLGAVVLV
ncbi:hypothetical protein CDD81_5948 [Ophiocordyceps australis]|uniref:Uncharacterized protein n=1 Tax=Ophiocordyceps australis TaxID=1399860 RepID=A0A2C5YGI7_9HYPO|nr:hypothetical protein CDD81_5948 [Ophiocordyceps australis]